MTPPLDPTLTSVFIGGLNRRTTQETPRIQMEVSVNELVLKPGSTCTVPLTVPPGFHVMDQPELRFTLERTFPFGADFSFLNRTFNGSTIANLQQFADVRLSDSAAVGAFLNGQNTNGAMIDLNPYALGWHTGLGVYGMFDYFRAINTRGEIIDECSDNLTAAKWVEKQIATASEDDLQLLDLKMRTNICQDTTIQQNIRPATGLSGTYYFSSYRAEGTNIVFSTELSVPLPFFMGKHLYTHFLGPCELQTSLTSSMNMAFHADMKFWTGFMETAVDMGFKGDVPKVQNSYTDPITSVVIHSLCTPVANPNFASLPQNSDASAVCTFFCNALKLSTTDLEAIVGNESCRNPTSPTYYPHCQWFSTGFDLFTKVTKLGSLTTSAANTASFDADPHAGHVLRDQWIRHHVCGSNVLAVVKGSSMDPTTNALPILPTTVPESIVSDDDSVYVIFKNPLPLYAFLYRTNIFMFDPAGNAPANIAGPLGAGYGAFGNTPTTGVPQGIGALPTINTIGMSYVLVQNAPSGFTPNSNADVMVAPAMVTTNMDALGERVLAAPVPPPVSIIYPADITVSNCRLAFTARKLSDSVLQTMTDAFHSGGIRLKKIAPVFVTYNQTTSGTQQFKFSTFQTDVGFLQFQQYRFDNFGLGQERMLGTNGYRQYSLQQGSYTVQSSQVDTQSETFGNKFPLSVTDWSTGYTTLGFTTGSCGEVDHFTNIRNAWANCYNTKQVVNVAALHRMRTNGVYYAMNTIGGISKLRPREDWTFTYVSESSQWWNSIDLGIGFLASQQTAAAVAANARVYVQPLLNKFLCTYQAPNYLLANWAQLNPISTYKTHVQMISGTVPSPTLNICTIWCAREYVLSPNGLTGNTAAILTVNS